MSTENNNSNNNNSSDTIKQKIGNILLSGLDQLDSFLSSVDDQRKKNMMKQRIKELSPMAKSASGGVSGVFLLFIGVLVLGLTVGFFAVSLILYKRDLLTMAIFFSIPLIISIVLIILGVRRLNHYLLYSKYKQAFKTKPYASVKELSEYGNQSNKKTVKNLSKYQNEGLYPQAFFTPDHLYFVLSKGGYEILADVLDAKAEVNQKQENINALRNHYPQTYKIYQEIDQSKESINNFIRRSDDSKLVNELDKINFNLDHIQQYLIMHPGDYPEARSFLDYFLPTLRKLLVTYSDLKKEEVETKNVVESKQEIESVIGTINKALENMYNSFYTDTVIDVYSDVQVLKTMIHTNGLDESNFTTVINEEK